MKKITITGELAQKLVTRSIYKDICSVEAERVYCQDSEIGPEEILMTFTSRSGIMWLDLIQLNSTDAIERAVLDLV